MATRPEKALSRKNTRVMKVGGGYLMQRLAREEIGEFICRFEAVCNLQPS
jgi:hypothetical protein